MAITPVGGQGSFAGGFNSAPPTSFQIYPGGIGGVAAGNTVYIVGFLYSQRVVSVSDPKGNVWNIRRDGNTGMVLIDGLITTTLTGSDPITITHSGQGLFLYAFFVTSAAYYDTHTTSTWTGTAAAGGLITTKNPGELVIGAFGVFTSGSTAAPTMTTPGSGYLQQVPGIATNPSGATDCGCLRYEFKNPAGAAGSESPTATMSAAGTDRFGLAAAYTDIPTMPAMAVV